MNGESTEENLAKGPLGSVVPQNELVVLQIGGQGMVLDELHLAVTVEGGPPCPCPCPSPSPPPEGGPPPLSLSLPQLLKLRVRGGLVVVDRH